jgi:uncharacterized protein
MRTLVYVAVAALFTTTALQAQNSASLDLVTTDPKIDAPIVTLTVTGTAATKPDRAVIIAGVQTKAVSASDAMAQNAKQMQSVLTALKAKGVADKDIQTSSINLSQDYDYGDKGQVFKGYIANNSVTVRMKDITKIGGVLDTMVTSGATNINGPSFMVEDDTTLSEEARTKAMAKANNMSAFYAKNAGYARARLLSIMEGQDFGGPMPTMNMKTMDAAGGAGTPVEPGEVTKAINITVKYRLER